MFNLNEFLSNEYENEYGNKYLSPMKKNYSEPKIYSANGDLSKRWYVYYRFRNPKTGKLKRITPFYGDANKYKSKSDRMFVLAVYKHKIQELLKRGYNPFEDNSELIAKKEQNKTVVVENKLEAPVENYSNAVIEVKQEKKKEPSIAMTLKDAFDFALNIKKK